MFVQHGEYYLNTSNINYFKVREQDGKVLVFFNISQQGVAGGLVTLYYDGQEELEELIAKLTK
ncbi:hypothetical protein OFM92_06045 [Acinetobacter baumannii]|nr:hypothetical protein [Acinetobacter baumannii]